MNLDTQPISFPLKTPPYDATSTALLAVAELLVEAAHRVHDGDSEAARTQIADAVELFQRESLKLATGPHLRPVNQDMRTSTKMRPRFRPNPSEHLSARESAVLALIAQGQSNKHVARTLNVAPETIKSHLKHMFLKLGAKTRAEAVARAARMGQLVPRYAGT
jgi:ATP/maltotriose-dependent transcriptional regulator MalT